jgi:hypothetical protein
MLMVPLLALVDDIASDDGHAAAASTTAVAANTADRMRSPAVAGVDRVLMEISCSEARTWAFHSVPQPDGTGWNAGTSGRRLPSAAPTGPSPVGNREGEL